MDAVKPQLLRPRQNVIKFVMPVAVLAAALFTVTLAVPALEQAIKSGFGASGSNLASDVRGFLRNPLAYFDQRSPGSRDSRDLVQLKHRSVPLGRKGTPPAPHERVLPNIRYEPPIPGFLNDLVPGVGPGIPDFGPPPAPVVVPNGPNTPPDIVPPVAPVVTPPPGSIPGGTPGGTTSVPEPSTWFMLIWGMALVGFGLRAKHRQLAQG